MLIFFNVDILNFYPFTEPAVRPEIIYLFANRNTRMTGITVTVAPAVRSPHLVPHDPTRRTTSTVSVLDAEDDVNVFENRKSFHAFRKEYVPTVTRPGAVRGSAIRSKA